MSKRENAICFCGIVLILAGLFEAQDGAGLLRVTAESVAGCALYLFGMYLRYRRMQPNSGEREPHVHLWSGGGPDAECIGCLEPRQGRP